MPSYRLYKHPSRPWYARVKRDGVEWGLGYHATEDEARDAERVFAELWKEEVADVR